MKFKGSSTTGPRDSLMKFDGLMKFDSLMKFDNLDEDKDEARVPRNSLMKSDEVQRFQHNRPQRQPDEV